MNSRILSPLQRWLIKTPTGFETVLLVCIVFLLDVFNSVVVSGSLALVGALPAEPEGPAFSIGIVVTSIVFAAIVEELIFRIIPLTLALRRWGVGIPTLVILVFSSILFGVAHGSPLNILAQGVGGLAFGLLFIKISNTGKRPFFAGLIVIGMHLVFDTLVFLIVLSVGSTF